MKSYLCYFLFFTSHVSNMNTILLYTTQHNHIFITWFWSERQLIWFFFFDSFFISKNKYIDTLLNLKVNSVNNKILKVNSWLNSQTRNLALKSFKTCKVILNVKSSINQLCTLRINHLFFSSSFFFFIFYFFL